MSLLPSGLEAAAFLGNWPHHSSLCFLHPVPFSPSFYLMVSIQMKYLGHLFICITSISESVFSNIESFHFKISIWFIFIFSISLVIFSTCLDIIFMVFFSYWSMVPFSSLSRFKITDLKSFIVNPIPGLPQGKFLLFHFSKDWVIHSCFFAQIAAFF